MTRLTLLRAGVLVVEHVWMGLGIAVGLLGFRRAGLGILAEAWRLHKLAYALRVAQVRQARAPYAGWNAVQADLQAKHDAKEAC
jgi:hypothetical protein